MERKVQSGKPTAPSDPALSLAKAIWLEQYKQEQTEADPNHRQKLLDPKSRVAMGEKRKAQWQEQRGPFLVLARRVLRQLERGGLKLQKTS